MPDREERNEKDAFCSLPKASFFVGRTNSTKEEKEHIHKSKEKKG